MMHSFRYSRLAFFFAVVLLVMAPVASAFVCGSPAEDCCDTARIDHPRETNHSSPIVVLPAVVSISPIPLRAGTSTPTSYPPALTIAASLTPLRI